MAVQVVDHPGISYLQSNNDGGCADLPSSLQCLMNLLSQKQIMPKAQDALSQIPLADQALHCKKAGALTGGLTGGLGVCGLGHARFRRPPQASPSAASPTPVFHMPQSGGSPVTPPLSLPLFQSSPSSSPTDVDQSQERFLSCHDATPPMRSSNMLAPDLPPDFSCRNVRTPDVDDLIVNACGAMRNVHGNMHTTHVSHACDLGMTERNADGSVYDASTLHISRIRGHARCREAVKYKMDVEASYAKPFSAKPCAELDQAVGKTNSSLVSSLSMEERGGTVSSGKPLFSSARPPLPPKKRKDFEKVEETSRKCHKSGLCHCAHKRRKLHGRSVAIIEATIDSTSLEITVPDDGYSWCTYGEKFIEGSVYPRVYYKCCSVQGCPARKHVQRTSEGSNNLIVTYGRQHVHPPIQKVSIV